MEARPLNVSQAVEELLRLGVHPPLALAGGRRRLGGDLVARRAVPAPELALQALRLSRQLAGDVPRLAGIVLEIVELGLRRLDVVEAPPGAADERRYLPQLSGCIACGLCDVGEGERMAASKGLYGGVMDLMLASSRGMPDYDATVRSFNAISEERLAQLEARCPTRVPMRQLAAFVRAKAAEVSAPVERDAASDPAP